MTGCRSDGEAPRSKRERLFPFAWRRRGIIDQPFGPLTGFGDRRHLGCKDDVSVSWSPCLTLIRAINAIARAPCFIRRVVYLASGCIYREAFVVVIHASIVARLRHGQSIHSARRDMLPSIYPRGFH